MIHAFFSVTIIDAMQNASRTSNMSTAECVPERLLIPNRPAAFIIHVVANI